jgi:hypothetical protein
MRNYHFLKSILTINGKKYPVYLHDWARLTLPEDELLQFENDLFKILDPFQEKMAIGEFDAQRIMESFETPQGTIEIEVGLNIQCVDDFQSYRPPEDILWHQRMASDPNVNYKSSVILIKE